MSGSVAGAPNLAVIDAVTQFVGGTQAVWNDVTIPIPEGLVVYAIDTTALKIGDGVTLYVNLPVLFTLNSLTGFAQQIAALSSSESGLQSAAQVAAAISAALTPISASIATLTTEDAGFQTATQVNALIAAALASLNTSISTLNTEVTNLTSADTGFQTANQVTTIVDGALTSVNTSISTLNTEVATLTTDVTNLTTAQSNLPTGADVATAIEAAQGSWSGSVIITADSFEIDANGMGKIYITAADGHSRTGTLVASTGVPSGSNIAIFNASGGSITLTSDAFTTAFNFTGSNVITIPGSCTITLTAAGGSWSATGGSGAIGQRYRLDSDYIIYIDPNAGSDATGKGTQAAPFASFAHVYNIAIGYIDISNRTLTIQLASGDYPSIDIYGLLPGQSIPSQFVVAGNGPTTRMGVVNPGVAAINVFSGAQVTLQNLEISNSNNESIVSPGGWQGLGLIVSDSLVAIGANVYFGACGQPQIYCGVQGQINVAGPVHITVGNCGSFCLVEVGAYVSFDFATISIDNVVTYTNGFINTYGRCDFAGTVFVNAGNVINTVRYYVNTFGYLDTNGGGASFIPGDQPGAIATAPLNGTSGSYNLGLYT